MLRGQLLLCMEINCPRISYDMRNAAYNELLKKADNCIFLVKIKYIIMYISLCISSQNDLNCENHISKHQWKIEIHSHSMSSNRALRVSKEMLVTK